MINQTFQICDISDIDAIHDLYEQARIHQRSKKMVIWPYFEKEFLEKEIKNQQQWKLLVDNELACNWTITFNDPEIWEGRDQNDGIYIHRIATNPKFRGNNFVKSIVDWAKPFAAGNNRRFIRLDTLGNNTRLIDHYISCGFHFLGMFRLTNTKTLPLHYQEEPNCCLFEIDLGKV